MLGPRPVTCTNEKRSLSDRARMGYVGPCIVRHRNAAERQQECEHDPAREATVGDELPTEIVDHFTGAVHFD